VKATTSNRIATTARVAKAFATISMALSIVVKVVYEVLVHFGAFG